MNKEYEYYIELCKKYNILTTLTLQNFIDAIKNGDKPFNDKLNEISYKYGDL